MKTTNNYTANHQETGKALSLFLVLFIMLLVISNLTAAPTDNVIPGSYSAECNNHQAIIKWEVSGDNANSHYSIERTQDGVHFELVTDVEAVIGSSDHEYSAIDDNPLNGVSYYRISKVSEQGESTYLNTISYTPCEDQEDIESFNTSTAIFLQISSKAVDTCSIVLKNTDGKVVLSENRIASIGLNNFKIEPKVEKGVYVLCVKYHNLKLNKVLLLESGMTK